MIKPADAHAAAQTDRDAEPKAAGFRIHVRTSEAERTGRERFLDHMRASSIPDNELLPNLGLYLTRQTLSRILFMHELYLMTRDVHGVIMEFGVRWGQTLALMTNFRGMHEPFNYNKKVIGFDTFRGFPAVSDADGTDAAAVIGNYSVTDNHQSDLREILRFHESESPIPHIEKHELVAGDVRQTVPAYFDDHPETVVALAFFDLDLYEPTLACLEAIRPRLTRGSVVAFDQLNHPTWPGETAALAEVLGLGRFAIRHLPSHPAASYLVVDEPIDC